LYNSTAIKSCVHIRVTTQPLLRAIAEFPREMKRKEWRRLVMKFIILLLARPSALVDMSSAELIIAMVGDCQVGKVPAASHTYESALHLVMMYRDLHTHTHVSLLLLQSSLLQALIDGRACTQEHVVNIDYGQVAQLNYDGLNREFKMVDTSTVRVSCLPPRSRHVLPTRSRALCVFGTFSETATIASGLSHTLVCVHSSSASPSTGHTPYGTSRRFGCPSSRATSQEYRTCSWPRNPTCVPNLDASPRSLS